MKKKIAMWFRRWLVMIGEEITSGGIKVTYTDKK